jgi:hypothetical protein
LAGFGDTRPPIPLAPQFVGPTTKLLGSLPLGREQLVEQSLL